MEGHDTTKCNDEYSSSVFTQSTSLTAGAASSPSLQSTAPSIRTSLQPTAPSIRKPSHRCLDKEKIDQREKQYDVATTNTSTTESTNNINSSQSYLIPVPWDADNLVKVYRHKKDAYKCIFPFACQAFADLRPDSCKFNNRGCLLRTWNLANEKVQNKFLSAVCTPRPNDNTVFSVPSSKQRSNGVFLADTKLITCMNPKCVKLNEEGEEIPTVFHYCCYVNMRYSIAQVDLNYNEELDKFPPAQTEIIRRLRTQINENGVIMPFCSKSCYNKIVKKRKNPVSEHPRNRRISAKKSTGDNETSGMGNLRWDNDSRNGSRTSEEIIVHWLIDQQNPEKYFGGNHGSNNSVNGTRKEAYHGQIRDIILKENGKYK